LTSNGTWNWHTRIGAWKFPSCTGGGGGGAPVVNSFSPTSGPVGTNVDVTGSGFTGATVVKFGGVPATAFNVDSDAELHATVPTGAQTGPIAVTTGNGTGTSSTNFTVTTGGGGNPPTVSSFNPTSGPVGTNVSITGTNFTGATGVTFNGTAATYTFNSDTSISAHVPTGATTGPIAVTTGIGTGTSLTDFTVTTPPKRPTISSFTPTSGHRGISVTINGTNFTGITAVKLGLIVASFTVNSSTKITATVPSTAHVGSMYRWSVTNAAGTATSFGYFRVTG
jgi:IPT/TIG domain